MERGEPAPAGCLAGGASLWPGRDLLQPEGLPPVHERGRVILVPLEQVIYLKAELKYITVRTREREYLIEE